MFDDLIPKPSSSPQPTANSLATPEQRQMFAEYQAQLPGLEQELDSILAQKRAEEVNFDDLVPAAPVSFDDLVPAQDTKPGPWQRIKDQTAGVMGEIQGVDTYLRQGPKPDWSDVNAIPAGIIKAGDRAISAAVHFPAGVAEHYLGSDDKRDAHFNEIKNRAALTKLFTDDKFPTTGSKLSEITEGVAQLPYFLADKVLAAFSVTGNAVETTNSLIDQGVDFQTAVVVAGLQGGGDAALAMLPGMKGNPTVARLLAQGPVTGAGLNYIAYEMLMQKGHTEAAKAFDPRDPANIIPDLVGAGVAGKAARDNQKALAGDNIIKDKAQAILTARKEIRDLEAKMAEEAAAKGEVPPITPVPPKAVETAPKQGELDLQNQNAAYELATGHKTEAPESPRIDAARLEDTTQPEVARTAPEPDSDPTKQPDLTQIPLDLPIAPKSAPSRTFYKPLGNAVTVSSNPLPPVKPKEWSSFGKIVDEAGAPITVYHGTKDSFGDYDPGLSRDSGVWFATDPKTTDGYALGDGANVRPAYVKLENPYEAQVGESRQVSLEKAIYGNHDGVIVRDANGKIEAVSVFDAANIRDKLADPIYKPTEAAALTNDGRRVVFKGQAGAAHVDLISGGLASVADKISSAVRKPSDSTSPLAKGDQQREAMSKIPGQSDLKNHVSKDTPPDTVIAKLKELGKDMKPHWDWIGGPELTGWIKDNPMVYAMSSWWGNGHDRHNLNNKEVIVPLEHRISKLVRTGKMYDVMAVRQAEMYAKERLSAEDLAKIGMSPEQIAVHQEMTRQFDAQLARTNEILRSQNRPEIAAHEAYSASQRRGNWKTPVYDKKGKIVGFVQETSKGRAHYALKRIAKAHPDVDISKSKPEMDMSASDGTSRFAGMDNFTALNKILGSDHPLVQEIRSTQDQMIREMGTNVLGFDKHMLPKTGARYAFGEQPWKTDHQNIIDWAEGQVAYLRDASLWSELQQAATNTKLVLNDPTLKADQPMTLQWARDKMNSELGYGARPAVRKMERILSKGLGDLAYEFSKVFPPLAHMPTDMRSINQGIGVGKAVFYIQKLGFFNGKFMGISLMQPAYAVSHHMRLSKEGYRHNPIQTLAEAQWMSSVALMGHYSPSFSKKVDPHLSKTLSNAIKYMEANGIANINQMSEVGDLDQSPTMRVLTEGAQFSISQPERIARTEVFMTFVSHLNQAKARGDWKGTEHEMFQKAEEVMTMVMGNYNHNDRAMVFNKLGAAGGALNALKTYPLNMAGQMVGFAKDGVRGNGYSPLMAQIGIGLALAGSMGIMGREYIEGLWDWLLEGYVAAGFSDPAVINFSPLKVMLEMGEASGAFGLFSEAMNAVGATSEDKDKLAKGLQYGLPSVASGRDLSGSLGNQGPEPTVDGMLPWLADFSKQSHKVGTFLLDKDQRSADRAIHALAPSSVQGNLEMSLPTMTNPDRPNLQLPINNPDMPGIERTQKMIDAKKTLTAPTNTIEESDARKILYKKQQNEKFFNKAKINVAEKFNAAVFQGHGETELKRLLTRYTELDGDPDTLINGIDKKAEARMMTFMERLGEAANTDVAALKYKRYKEAWDRRIQEKK